VSRRPRLPGRSGLRRIGGHTHAVWRSALARSSQRRHGRVVALPPTGQLGGPADAPDTAVSPEVAAVQPTRTARADGERRPGARRAAGARSRRAWLWALAGLAAGVAVTITLLVGIDRHGTGDAPQHAGGERLPVGRLLAAVAVIVLLAHLCGAAVRRWLGQPPVVGHIAAGLAFGPVLVGGPWPDGVPPPVPPAALPQVTTLGQLGLVFFVVLVGYELALGGAAAGRSVLAVAAAGVAVPFLLSSLVVVGGYRPLAAGTSGFLVFACFLGVVASATAVPVLALIVADRKLTGTALGATALAAASVTDLVVWLVLTGVLATTNSGTAPWALAHATVGLVAAGLCAVLLRRAVRSVLGRIVRPPPVAVLAALIVLVLAAAAVADALFGHPSVGALVFGIALPRGLPAVQRALRQLRAFTESFLLPVFFVHAGMGVRVEDLAVSGALGWFGLLALAAVGGKLIGCTAAALATGLPGRPALALGVLMNCRGATELVIIDIGLAVGLLPRGLAAALIILTLVTTAATTPLVAALLRPRGGRAVRGAAGTGPVPAAGQQAGGR
jgi:Kef-type K+ transport system membrane component KefB